MTDLSYLLSNHKQRFNLSADVAPMQAVLTMGNGDYDQLQYREVPMPRIAKGEVLLKVLAAGINNTEINTRLGWYSSSIDSSTDSLSDQDDHAALSDGGWNNATPFPLIQGTDCCGEIVEVAAGLDHLQLGQRVLVRPCMRQFGFHRLDNIWLASDFDGAFAQYVKVPASEVFAIHSTWTDAELATIPCAYGTAENMLHCCAVDDSDHVLISGASGGVGSALVQLAKRRGAKVTALASSSKMAAVKRLGADHVLARDANLLKDLGEQSVSVVIDNVAGDNFCNLIKCLQRGGRYASSGAIAGPMVNMDLRDFYLRDLRLIGCTAWQQPIFNDLIGYIERNEIKPVLAKTFALADIVEAQREFNTKQHVGKFVLIPPH